MVEKKEKVKTGRKPWIPSEDDLLNVEKYSSRFLKEEQIATLIGVSPSTFTEKKKHFPQLLEAIRRGRAKLAANISNKAYELAIKGNGPLLLFFMKSVVGLKENDPQIRENVTFNVITSKGTEKLQFSDE